MAFTHTKKVYTESFIKGRIQIRYQTSGSGSDQKGPDTTDPDPDPQHCNLESKTLEDINRAYYNLNKACFNAFIGLPKHTQLSQAYAKTA
jgi:hypothetical protein